MVFYHQSFSSVYALPHGRTVVFVAFLTLAHFPNRFLSIYTNSRALEFEDFEYSTEQAPKDGCHQGCSSPIRSLPFNELCLELPKKAVIFS